MLKLDVPAEVKLNDFTGMDNDTIVFQEVTEDGTVWNTDGQGQRTTQRCYTYYAANMVQSPHHFLMTHKDIPWGVLESCNTVQEFMEKSLLRQSRKKLRAFLRSEY